MSLFYYAAVKIQFFKTFVLPYFDYCLSLLIYFPKTTIQRINNCFNLCLYKLFNFKMENSSNIEKFNDSLTNYGLFSFQHRIMNKLFNFTHSIVNNSNAPSHLHQVFKQEQFTNSRARNPSLILPVIRTHFGEKSFSFFFINFFNNFGKKSFFNSYATFVNDLNRYSKIYFQKFIHIFPIFDLFYKNLDYLSNKKKQQL
jgi:hypothetical protein